ncbi:MAG: glutamate-cysteine ligase family protein [Candidatus Jordarchaeales archaeon]
MPRLPFTQGIEMEVQVVDEKGRLLRGAPLLKVWKHLMENALRNLQKAAAGAPPEVAGKLLSVSFKEKERRGKRLPYVVASYKTHQGSVEIDVFGPDPNVSQITWILELVTPPCESMEELEWWIKTLYSVAYASLPSGYSLISIGFNPLEEEYRSGVTFGDHYHIGGMRRQDIPAVYNMIRAFIPHMIALTANSPFIKEGVTGVVKVQKKGKIVVLGKDCIRDIRLKYNTSQVGPVDKDHYIPYLESLDRRFFDSVVMREPPDDRYVDVFPFTDYGTIEVRVFDSQFSVARRLALVALLQALALKAVKLTSNGGKVPNVSSSVLVENREKAILYALLGKFFIDRGLQGRAASIYNASPSGSPYTKLFEAVQGMFEYVREEVEALGFQEYLEPFLVSVYGSKRLEPPCSPADYLLYLYDSSGGNMSAVVRSLMEITRKYCTGSGDPVIEAFGEAEVEVTERLRPAIKVSMRAETAASMVVAGEKIPFTLDLEGEGDVQATLIAKVVLAERNEAIQTTIKKVALKAGKPVKITGSQLPLTIPLKAFQGTKACRLKFTLKGDGVETREVETKIFKAIATPSVRIMAETPPKTIIKGEKRELKVRVESKTPEFKGEYQVTILAEKPGKTTPLLSKKISIPTVLNVTLPSSVEEHYILRIQVSYMGELVAEQKTTPIKVEKKVEPTAKPAKPARLTAEVQQAKAATVKSKKLIAPPATLATTPIKTESTAARTEEAKPRVKVITSFTPPTPAKIEPRTTVKATVSSKSSARTAQKTPTLKAQHATKPSKLARPSKPSQRLQEASKPRSKAEATTGVRISRAVDVSHVSLRPRVSVSGDVSSSLVKWGETCKAVFEVRNLNPEVTGPFLVEVILEGEEEKLLDCRELTVKQSERLTYKVKAGEEVKGEAFALVCRILHGEAVLAECRTRSVQVTSLPVKDAVKVIGVDIPKEVASSSTLVVKFKVEVKGIVKPVRLIVSAETDTTVRREYDVQEGKHVIPLPVKAWREEGRRKLRVSLEAEGVKIYRKELDVQTLPLPPVAVTSITINAKTQPAGGKASYSIGLRNVKEQPVEAKGKIQLVTLQGELETENKVALKLKPKGETEIRGKMDVPPWLTGKQAYIQAILQLKTGDKAFTLTEVSPLITVTSPPTPLVKVTVTKLPPTLTEDQNVKLTISVKKKVQTPIQVQLVAVTPTATQKIWSGKIKQQEKVFATTWKTPKTQNPTQIQLKTEIYAEGKPIPPQAVQAPTQKIKLTKKS